MPGKIAAFCLLLCTFLQSQNLQVIDVSPTLHSTQVSSSEQVFVRFNASVNVAELLSHITVYGFIRGMYQVSITNNLSQTEFTIIPIIPFQVGEKINVIMHSEIKGLNGESFYGFQWSFYIQPTTPTAPVFSSPIIGPNINSDIGSVLIPYDFESNPYTNLAAISNQIQSIDNDGAGNFSIAQQISGNTGFNPDIGITDFNRDGFGDFIAGTGIFEQLSANTFQLEVPLTDYSHEAHDFNRDGLSDLLVSSILTSDNLYALGILYQDSSNTFQQLDTLLTDSLIIDAIAGDFNNDGISDIAYITQIFAAPGGPRGNNSVRILYLDAQGDTLDWVIYNADEYPFWGFPSQISHADFNNDGFTDLFVGSNADDVILLNDPNSFFQLDSVIFLAGGDAFHWTSLADVNADGRIDLLFCERVSFEFSGGCGFLLNTTHGFTTHPVIEFRAGVAPNFVAGSDFDGDGAIDIAALWSDGLRIYLNEGLVGIFPDAQHGLGNFHITQNYPNPFNPTTRVEYSVRSNNSLESTIFDIQGRVVKRFAIAGTQNEQGKFEWDGTDETGKRVASGVYFWRFSNTYYAKTIKVILNK